VADLAAHHAAPGRRLRIAAYAVVAVLAVIVLLLALAWFGGRWYLSGSVARYSGEVRVEGLRQPVEITFDGRGIPQIRAETDADAYFALGWVHASERLFQMELLRRLSSGSLAELFGEAAFRSDVRQRTIGFHRLGERVLAEADDRSRALVEAYVAGINRWIDQARVLPPEFVVLRTRPEAWAPVDVTTAFVYQSWYPTELADRRWANRTVLAGMGEEALDLISIPRPWTIPSAPEGALAALLDPDHFPMRMTVATNNWALAPSRSVSGHALHAADPHLAINALPGFWYLVGLHSREGTGALGVTAAGIPVVPMGHNGRAAWSFSVAPLFLTDHFAETFDPQDSLRVLTPEGYAPVEMVWEEIRVKGEDDPRRIPVHRTPRGVVVERNGATGTSMHWSGFDLMGGDALAAAFEVSGVATFDAFQAVVDRLPVLSVNWIYSDRTGNIGYQLGPAIPRRSYNPVTEQDAADPEVRLDGYHEPEMRPSALNPGQGWVATTNNRPAPDDWPVEIHGAYNLFRMERVEAWMNANERLDRSDMERMQLDYVSGRAERWRGLAAHGAAELGEDDLALRLRAWDANLAPGEPLAAVFALWSAYMTRHLFEDRLGADWGAASTLRDIVLVEDHAHLIDDARTPEVETAVDISARAMRDAIAAADGRPLGEVQRVHMTHPLSQAPLLDRWLNLDRGPIPRGGDTESLNLTAGSFDAERGTFRAQIAPSMRYVMDWADVDAFTMAVPVGQSGNPFSPHYDDFLAHFENEPWVVPFSREAVAARAVSRLVLRPAGEGGETR
jgi:penicillin G amidase